MKRLPDTEFSVMNAIWEIDGMINSTTITQKLSEDVHWKTQTLLTLLARLCEKGFLSSEKIGRDRFYKVLISKDDYLNFETEDLMKRYTGNTAYTSTKRNASYTSSTNSTKHRLDCMGANCSCSDLVYCRIVLNLQTNLLTLSFQKISTPFFK